MGFGAGIDQLYTPMSKTAEKVGQDGAILPKLNLHKIGPAQGGQLLVKGTSNIDEYKNKNSPKATGIAIDSVVKLMGEDIGVQSVSGV